MRAILALMVALAGGFGASGALAANLIRDGGFETPPTPVNGFVVYDAGQTFSRWKVVGASGNVATVSTTFTQNGYSFPARRGQAWLDLTGLSNSATGVSQTINTTIGTHYTVTFWVGNVADPGGIFGTTSTVNVYDGANLLLAATNSRGTGQTRQVWQQFTTNFTAAATRTTLSFYNGDPSGDTNCGLDSVSVAVTP